MPTALPGSLPALPPTLLAVHAHPDDETLTTGGILARCGAAGVRTVLVTCTRGDLGEIAEPGLAEPETLGAVREQELAQAARILGIQRTVVLGYRDSGMAGSPDNHHPQAFAAADLEGATRRLVAVVREERPQVMVTYDENGGYGHPDHVQAHRLATAAFQAAGDASRFPDAGPPWAPSKLYAVVFPLSLARRFAEVFRQEGIAAPFSAPAGADAGERAPEFGTPDRAVTTAVDVAAVAQVKRAALAAHRTQLGTVRFLLRLPFERLRELWRFEYFRLAAGASGAALPGALERDLFQGLPIRPSAGAGSG